MPTVPVYQQNVAQKALPGARLSESTPTPDAYGDAIGRGLTSIGKAMSDAAAEQKKQADQIAFLDADRRLSESLNKMQYDPATGIANTRGKAAFGLPEKVLSDFDKTAAEIEAALTNDEQRLAFRRSAQSRRGDLDSFTQRHVSREIEQYDESTTQAYIENSRNSAVLNYQDPQRVRLELDRQRAALTDYGTRRGVSPELLAQRIGQAYDQTHIGVIDHMLANGNDAQAKVYFESVRGEISGAQVAKVQQAVEAGALRGDSQRMAGDIVATAQDRLSAMDAVAKIEDPKLRDETSKRVDHYYSVKKQAEAERRADIFLKSSELLEKSRGNLDAISPVSMLALEPSQRQALELRSRQIREGVEPAHNDKVWLQFLDAGPTELANLTQADMLTKYRPYLDNAHWDRATTLWKATKEGKGSSEHLTSALTFKDRVDNTFRDTGLVGAGKSKAKFSNAEAKAYGKFETEAASALQHFEQTALGGKRKATGDEMQKVLDDLVRQKVFIEKTWSTDPEMPAVLVTEDKRARAYVPVEKIPTADRNAIENLIRSRGKRISEDKLQRAYAQYVIGDRAAFDRILGE